MPAVILRTMTIAALPLFALLFVAACSGSGDGGAPAATAAAIDACSLLDAAGVGAAIGVSMKDGRQGRTAGGGENEGAMTTCHWEAPDDTPGFPSVTLMVWSWPKGSGGAAGYLDSFREAAAQYKDLPAPEPVSLGDEALFDGTGLHVRRGDVSFSLAVSGVDAGKAREAMTGLASAVLGKL